MPLSNINGKVRVLTYLGTEEALRSVQEIQVPSCGYVSVPTAKSKIIGVCLHVFILRTSIIKSGVHSENFGG